MWPLINPGLFLAISNHTQVAKLIKVIESQVSRRGDRQSYIGSFLPLLSFLVPPLLPCLLADGYSWHILPLLLSLPTCGWGLHPPWVSMAIGLMWSSLSLKALSACILALKLPKRVSASSSAVPPGYGLVWLGIVLDWWMVTSRDLGLGDIDLF